MVEKQLKNLSRAELLEILLEQGKENERLQDRIQKLEQKLQERMLNINKAGSIAEAALALHGVFEAAEASCLQYTENIRALSERQAALSKEYESRAKAEAEDILRKTRERCAALEAETKRKCDQQIWDADKTVEEKWTQISQRLTALYNSHEGLKDLVKQGVSLIPERRDDNASG